MMLIWIWRWRGLSFLEEDLGRRFYSSKFSIIQGYGLVSNSALGFHSFFLKCPFQVFVWLYTLIDQEIVFCTQGLLAKKLESRDRLLLAIFQKNGCSDSVYVLGVLPWWKCDVNERSSVSSPLWISWHMSCDV